MRVSRLFRLLIRMLLLLLTLSMSFISFLGGLSAIQILSNPDNVVIPNGEIEYNPDPLDPENNSIKIPFKFKNDGYFDLEDLYIKVSINLKYKDNITLKEKNVLIYEAETKFGTIKRGATLKDSYESDPEDFITENFPELTDFATNRMAYFTADVYLKASYSLGLLSFSVKVFDIDIGEKNITITGG